METSSEKINRIEPDSRLAIFSALAQALDYPSKDLAVGLKTGDYVNDLSNALQLTDLNHLNRQMIQLTKEYAESAQSAEDILLALEKEYTRMFFASKPRLVHLFESVYREGKLLQESTFDIARLYYEAGLEVDDNFRLPPDHIAVEMEFMAYLCFNELKARQESDEEKEQYAGELQKKVIDKHLTVFAGRVAEKLNQCAKSDFYKTIGWILTELFQRPRISVFPL
jgi:TorA maturation chaperone TorD